MAKDKTEPMDVTVIENRNPVAQANNQRNCYAMKTLVNEVLTLFPETPYEPSAYDGRNVALDVTFDLTTLDTEDWVSLARLLELTESDPRVDYVIAGGQAVLVSFKPSARTQDSREPFGLAEAWTILTDAMEEPPC